MMSYSHTMLTSLKIFTYTVNKWSYSHAMLIKNIMLTKIISYLRYVELLVNLFRIKLPQVAGAGATPLRSVIFSCLYLVETNLVNIMLENYLKNESVISIKLVSYGLLLLVLSVMCYLLFVMCYVLLVIMGSLITNIYITITHYALMCNALGITDQNGPMAYNIQSNN